MDKLNDFYELTMLFNNFEQEQKNQDQDQEQEQEQDDDEIFFYLKNLEKNKKELKKEYLLEKNTNVYIKILLLNKRINHIKYLINKDFFN